MPATRPSKWPTRAAAAGLTACVLLAAGCSGGDEDGDEDSGSPARETAHGVATKVTVGAVNGKLSRERRAQVIEGVQRAVDSWYDGAYVVGDYPREDFPDAFTYFTPDAAKLAAAKPAIMSNAKVGGEVDSVTAAARSIDIDVLAPKGRPAGVTAHVRLVIELDGAETRTDLVAGRLLLTPTEDGWRVFGFHIRRQPRGSAG